MINFILINVNGILGCLKSKECIIDCYGPEFICCLKFIISLLYACAEFMHVIYPIALLTQTLMFFSVLNLKTMMIGQIFLVIIVVVDCSYIGRFQNVKSSFLLIISFRIGNFSVFIFFQFIKIQYYKLKVNIKKKVDIFFKSFY